MTDEPTPAPAPHMPAWRKALFFLKFLEIRLRFVFILVITALVVGYWDHVQNYYERWQRHRAEASGQVAPPEVASDIEYFCPMHPFVVRDHADKCPICGMDLSKRKKGEAAVLPAGTLARVQVSPERILQAGVQIEPVLYHLLADTVRSYGTIETDETRQARIVARFPGRVDDLMVNAVGLEVKKDEPLARIYSPKFLAAAQEFLSALTASKRLDTDERATADDGRRAKSLADFARRRLALAGFTEKQLDELAASGHADETVTLYSPLAGTVLAKNTLLGETVEEGTVLYSIADLSTLWVQALVAEADLGAVRVGLPVEITTVASPGQVFYGTVDFVYPTINPESRSGKVRVVVDNANRALRPGMFVTATLRSPVGRWERAASGKPAASAASATPAAPAGPPPALPTKTKEAASRYLARLAPGAEYYSCPMEPDLVVSDKRDDCPICGMHLTKQTYASGTASGAPGARTASAEPLPALPTRTKADADRFLATLAPGAEYYSCPMEPDLVVSDKRDDCPICGMHLTKATYTLPSGAAMTGADGGTAQQWAEGWACPMHLDELSAEGGVCRLCPCGMQTVKWRIERSLAVPQSAVIDTGARMIVYVESEPGVYDARQVRLGRRAGAWYPVLEGLALGQRIVTHGSFLIDAEARLNPAAATAGAAAPTSATATGAAPAMGSHAGHGM